jgi:adenylate kinase
MTRADAILLIGPTGAGKTPLGNLMEKNGCNGGKCFHFDFGHQLRTTAGSKSPPEGFTAKEHTFIQRVLEEGLLLENEHFYIAEKVLHLFLKGRRFGDRCTLVLNGLPRHVDQARDVDRFVRVKSLILLECGPEDVYRRIVANSGQDRDGRTDDGFSMVRKKLEIFYERTSPLVEHYAGTGSTVFRIRVTESSTPEKVYSDFLAQSS